MQKLIKRFDSMTHSIHNILQFTILVLTVLQFFVPMPKAYNFLNVILSSMSDKTIFALCVILAKLFLSGWPGLGFGVSFGTLIPMTSEEEFKIERV